MNTWWLQEKNGRGGWNLGRCPERREKEKDPQKSRGLHRVWCLRGFRGRAVTNWGPGSRRIQRLQPERHWGWVKVRPCRGVCGSWLVPAHLSRPCISLPNSRSCRDPEIGHVGVATPLRSADSTNQGLFFPPVVVNINNIITEINRLP